MLTFTKLFTCKLKCKFLILSKSILSVLLSQKSNHDVPFFWVIVPYPNIRILLMCVSLYFVYKSIIKYIKKA